MRKNGLILIVIFLMLSVNWTSGLAAELFTEIPDPVSNEKSVSDAPEVIRDRTVRIDFDLLVSGNEPIELNVFDDVTYSAIMDRRQNNQDGSFTWIGMIQNQPESSVVLTANLETRIVSGTVFVDFKTYAINYVDRDVYSIVEIDPSQFPEDDDSPVLDSDEPVDSTPDSTSENTSAKKVSDPGNIMTILVVYTTRVLNELPGSTVKQKEVTAAN